MKTTRSLSLGLISSLLLTMGLTRAAERFDVSAQYSRNPRSSVQRPAPGCTDPCNLISSVDRPAPGCTDPCNLISVERPAPGCTDPCNLL